MAARTGPASLAYKAYRALPAPVHGLGERMLQWRAERSFRTQPGFAEADTRLMIGPLNTAGQAAQWASSANRHLPGVTALSVWAQRGNAGPSLGYSADVQVSRAVQLHGQRRWRELVLASTHLLAESGFRLFGDVRFGDIRDDLPALTAGGVATALLFHGSELRDLEQHAQLYPHSPFAGDDERFARMQHRVERNRQILAGADGPVLVATPDMLDFVPGAAWLPIVVDVDRFATSTPVLQRERPVVLHAPTNPVLKGTAVVEKVATEMHARGVIEYRRLQGVPHEQMPAVIADADIVIDQIVLGNVATLAAESMAAGRLVISHLAPHVRERFSEAAEESESIPAVDATPATLGSVLEGVLADREAATQLAARGPAWARRHHDGRRAAMVLGEVLGLT